MLKMDPSNPQMPLTKINRFPTYRTEAHHGCSGSVVVLMHKMLRFRKCVSVLTVTASRCSKGCGKRCSDRKQEMISKVNMLNNSNSQKTERRKMLVRSVCVGAVI